MKTLPVTIAALTLAACGAPSTLETVDESQARLVSAEDSAPIGPVDVRIIRACVTRSARVSTVQDGNYYSYSLELDIENSATNRGEFETFYRASLATPEDSYSTPVPVGSSVLPPTSIDASAKQTISVTYDSQVFLLNYWDIGVRTMGTKFPVYKMQKLIMPDEILTSQDGEFTRCIDY